LDVISCKEQKILTFPSSLILDIIDIGRGEEWGGAGGEGGRDPKEEDVADEPPHQAGRKQRSGRAARQEAGETMATSWMVGVLA
jgi:hypothetical protein